MKDCSVCRHSRREQTGPHAWRHDCALGQVDFPRAEWCAAYEPGADSRYLPESSGLGYVWDGEYEGPL